MNILRSKRLGRFCIDDDILESPLYREALYNLFGKMIILRAEFKYEFRGIEYLAFSDLFEQSDLGMIPPMYSVTITREKDLSMSIKMDRFDNHQKAAPIRLSFGVRLAGALAWLKSKFKRKG